MENRSQKFVVLALFVLLCVSTVFLMNSVPHEDLKPRVQRIETAIENINKMQAAYSAQKQDALGATFSVPTAVALFESSLANRISSTANSMTLVSALDKTGTALASSTYGFIIDEGTASEEMVIADCTGTTCTNMDRGISPITGTTTVSALRFEHRRGASVKITNGPQLLILSRIVNGIGTFPNLLTYKTGTACSIGSANNTICDKAYIDGVAVAGASDANETTKGIVELGTALEVASSTILGSTGAALVIQAKNATDTPVSGCAAGYTSTAGAGCGVIAQLTGKIRQTFIGLSEAWTWTGMHTFSATTSIAASNVLSNALLLNGLAYKFPTTRGASSSVLMEDGSGNLNFNVPQGMKYTYATTTDIIVSNGYATSTSFTIPAGFITASSTIEFFSNVQCAAAGGSAGSCGVSLRTSTGVTLAGSLNFLSNQTSRNTFATLNGIVLFNHAVNSQTGLLYYNGGVDGVTTVSMMVNAVETTSSVDFTNAVSVALVVNASDSNSTIYLRNFVLKVTR